MRNLQVTTSVSDDKFGEFTEFASSPQWRNLFVALDKHCEDLKTYAANSIVSDFAYNKGVFHGALMLRQFLQTLLDTSKKD